MTLGRTSRLKKTWTSKKHLEMFNTPRSKTMQSYIGRLENNNSEPVKMEILYGMLPRGVMKN